MFVENPLLTVKELIVKLHQILSGKPKLSDQTLFAHLEGTSITLKLTRVVEPAQRFSLSTIEENREYALWSMRHNVVNE